MDPWVIWLVVAIGFAVGEMLTVSFYLAPFAGGALVAGVLDVAGVPTAFTVAAFLVVSVVLLTALRPIARRHRRMPPQVRTNTDALVGRTGVVLEAIANDDDAGLIRLSGQQWTARAYDEDERIPGGARVRVLEIRGATALVTSDQEPLP